MAMGISIASALPFPLSSFLMAISPLAVPLLVDWLHFGGNEMRFGRSIALPLALQGNSTGVRNHGRHALRNGIILCHGVLHGRIHSLWHSQQAKRQNQRGSLLRHPIATAHSGLFCL
jgi:hypothetical protein